MSLKYEPASEPQTAVFGRGDVAVSSWAWADLANLEWHGSPKGITVPNESPHATSSPGSLNPKP